MPHLDVYRLGLAVLHLDVYGLDLAVPHVDVYKFLHWGCRIWTCTGWIWQCCIRTCMG